MHVCLFSAARLEPLQVASCASCGSRSAQARPAAMFVGVSHPTGGGSRSVVFAKVLSGFGVTRDIYTRSGSGIHRDIRSRFSAGYVSCSVGTALSIIVSRGARARAAERTRTGRFRSTPRYPRPGPHPPRSRSSRAISPSRHLHPRNLFLAANHATRMDVAGTTDDTPANPAGVNSC